MEKKVNVWQVKRNKESGWRVVNINFSRTLLKHIRHYYPRHTFNISNIANDIGITRRHAYVTLLRLHSAGLLRRKKIKKSGIKDNLVFGISKRGHKFLPPEKPKKKEVEYIDRIVEKLIPLEYKETITPLKYIKGRA